MYATSAVAAMYYPMLCEITDSPYTNNSNSEPLSARVIIESEEIIGVINNFTALNAGFCLSQSAIVGENKIVNLIKFTNEDRSPICLQQGIVS